MIMHPGAVDQPLRFTIPSRHVRGRFVRLDGALNTILSAHDYPPQIRHLLAEAVTLAALIGSMLKLAEGQLTLQAQTQGGVVDLLVADYRDGELRGHVRYDAEGLAGLGGNPDLAALFGKGYLAVTFDRIEPSTGEPHRYQGIVPLEGGSLGEACQAYFYQSEQIPTLIKVAVESTEKGCRAGGFLIQHLPEGEEGRERLHVRLDHPEWEHVSILADTLTHRELLDFSLTAKEAIWRLFHEEDEVRVEEGAPLSRGCRCDPGHIRGVLSRFPEAERRDMADEEGLIRVDCEFCSRQFTLAADELGPEP